jgi:hypothetical protein
MSEIENQINKLNKSIEEKQNQITTLQTKLRQIPEKERKTHPDLKRIIRLKEHIKTLTGQVNTLQQAQRNIDQQRRITDILSRRDPKNDSDINETARKMGIDLDSPEKTDEELLQELEAEAEAEARAKADRERQERARKLFEEESRRQTLSELQQQNLENRKKTYEDKNPGKQWNPLVTDEEKEDENQTEEKEDENVILQAPSPIPPPMTIQPPTTIQPPIPPPKPPKKQNKTRKIKPTPEIELQQMVPDPIRSEDVSTPPEDGIVYDGDNLVPEEDYLNPPNSQTTPQIQIRPIPINAGFTETLVQRRFTNIGPMIPDLTLCPKILDTGKKVNGKYFFPSQFPNLTKHKPLVIDMSPQVPKGGRKSRKLMKIKNKKGRKSCKRKQRKGI